MNKDVWYVGTFTTNNRTLVGGTGKMKSLRNCRKAVRKSLKESTRANSCGYWELWKYDDELESGEIIAVGAYNRKER